MSVATTTASRGRHQHRSRRARARTATSGSLVFLLALWFSLFFGVMVLFALIVDTAIDGAARFDTRPDHQLPVDRVRPETTGFRAGILGSIWLMLCTALLAVPLGHRGGDLPRGVRRQRARWYNRLIEVNLQNLAAVPAIVYGLLAVAVMALIGFQRGGIVLGGAVALALLILPVVIITTREAIRAVPREIRHGSLALGATVWQTTWRQTLPSAVPGIATGTILGLSRAIGEAAPLHHGRVRRSACCSTRTAHA